MHLYPNETSWHSWHTQWSMEILLKSVFVHLDIVRYPHCIALWQRPFLNRWVCRRSSVKGSVCAPPWLGHGPLFSEKWPLGPGLSDWLMQWPICCSEGYIHSPAQTYGWTAYDYLYLFPVQAAIILSRLCGSAWLVQCGDQQPWPGDRQQSGALIVNDSSCIP